MNEMARPDALAADARGRRVNLLWLLAPLLALAVAGAALYVWDPLRAFDTGAPPVEKLTFERVILDGDGIHLKVRAGGSEPMTIAQVQVDDAYWTFMQAPPGSLGRVASAWLHVPYPWVPGEKHEVKVVTGTGTTFKHEIEVAIATPRPSGSALTMQAIVGVFVGIVPVAIGLMFYPALRGLGSSGLGFVLALTVGLLAFLLVDTLKEAIELALRAAAAFQGIAMVLLAATVTALGLFVIGRRRGVPTGLALATFIALGIGLHNLGEGLAIGAAFATGAAPLGTFLVLGFTLHNITEGIGIAAPLVEKRPPLSVFIGLALLAGAPAIVGMWLGSLAYAPQWSAFALAVGAGAILQVIVEVTSYLVRTSQRHGTSWLSPAVLAGFVCGIAAMYVTGMLVKI
ncbi:MAG: metal transporter [Rhizobiales bacterium]|nr:metal transporter [Hyphomicrobiales bacterium]